MAIEKASDGDTVIVQNGTYHENINFSGKRVLVSSYFLIDNDTTHITNTIISGSQSDSGSVVLFDSGEDSTSTLLGFTITMGKGTKIQKITYYGETLDFLAGGGIVCLNSSPKIIHNHIIKNVADRGGGVYIDSSEAIIKKCRLKANESVEGGGFFACCSNFQFVDNKLSGNMANWQGGGIYVAEIDGPNTIINKNVLWDNSSKDHGGAILIADDLDFNAKVSENLIKSNRSGMGGAGIYCRDSSPIISKNVIINNVAEGWTGGGIRCVRSGALIVNNTLNGNGSFGGGGGGGIYFLGDAPDQRPIPSILNNIITNSQGKWGIFCNSDTSLIAYNDVWNSVGGDISCSTNFLNISTDPLFIDPSEDNFDLQPSSPCIDSGTSTFVVGEDTLLIIPDSSFVGSAPDIGAFEFDSPVFVANEPTPNLDFTLFQNYPNPFNSSTTIKYFLTKSSKITLTIYNTLGQEVRTLVQQFQGAGMNTTIWDGKDNDGNTVTSGLYIYRLRAQNKTIQRKMLFLE
ncbi:MAG: T9SS type A sorting domain-containing protein [Aliifodinibius sp.]|nr:T9SS type A sorting domain-containing protein [Fodinibius sp.]NIY29869.1 T9SS type A sorting domain-containing protein [Fodinibius sp.]